MGWLPWSSGDSNKASDGGRIAPDRTSRARCWEGRDAFFACLDRNDILDGIKDDKEARRKCAKEVAEFEAACSATWVRTDSLYRAVDACPKGNKPILGSHLSMMAVHVFQIMLNAKLSFDFLGQILQGKACDGIQPRQDD